MDVFACPRGHESTERDYCSECGAKIGDAAPATSLLASVAVAAEEVACPKCGTSREDLTIPFCEACGYNFVTATGGAEHVVAAAAPVSVPVAPVPVAPVIVAPVQAAPTRWALTLSVDESLRDAGSPDPPADFRPLTFSLDEPSSLIGRRSEARAIHPEIPLSYDDAVSHRHALLRLEPDGRLELRDLGSSNGTRLNGRELRATVDYPLKDGDEITLGHWSRITVKAVS